MTTETGCKVEQTIRRYGLEDADPKHESLDEGLCARWKGERGHSSEGYRSLTEWFNKRLLKRVYDANGRDALGAQIENDYESLTGEDDLRRRELIERLETEGIDGAQVLEDMVSWGTMRTHLKECLGAEKEMPTAETEWERDTIEMATGFTREKAEDALSSLEKKGRLEGFEAATVDVQVHLGCDRCPTRVPLEVALDRGYVCEKHSRSNPSTEEELIER